MFLPLIPAVLLAPTAPPTLPPPAERKVDFVTEVRPLFARHCYACHGPAKQRSGFRLDVKADALKGGDSGPAILPGKSADSPLVKFVAGVEEPAMPPAGPRLTAQEVGVLRAWIDQGADWPAAADTPRQNPLDWWSFRPLSRPAVPAVPGAWNPVDAFVRAKLREKGLEPSPEADRRTLVRRLTFDLTGLPPTPDEIDACVRDPALDAYERLVDRLLASPAYGERWARHWLDVVHYGDTHGYDKDQPRPNAWPYRDYVIRALNADTPYGRFVREQVAGDVLFPGSPAGVEALGFLSAGPWDFIGHAELPESKTDGKIARHLDRDDVVTNTVQTFMSLTVQCAQCHDHKFDPISQEDYYSLHAVFAAIDRTDRAYDREPAVAARRRELEGRKTAAVAARAEVNARVAAKAGPRLAELDRAVAGLSRPAPAGRPVEYGYHSGIEPKPDVVKWVQVDLGRPVAVAAVTLYPCHDDFNAIGPGFGFPVRFRVEGSDDPAFRAGVVVIADRTRDDVPNPGLGPLTFDAPRKPVRFVRVTATKLASRLNDFICAVAELEVRDADGKNVAAGAAVTALDSIEAAPRWRKANLVDGKYPGSPPPAARLAELTRERDALLAGALSADDRARLAKAEEDGRTAEQELTKLPPRAVVYCGAVHTGSGTFVGTGANGGRPRPIAILPRGDVTKPGRPVGPGAIRAFGHRPPRFDPSPDRPEGARRAALAEWIADPNNPLTWRSIVNRVWRYHYGRGLVETPNDFGRMGQLPTHPELLDWLAVEFRDGGQSLKALHRLIVTSATYKQVSAGNDRLARLDADNAYYWRMNRRKLDAESVRDGILAVSGKLDRRMYGPGFRDFVIDKPEHSPHYEYHRHDPDDPRSHRRSVYRFLVRSQQQPFMVALDCADPSMQVDKRNESLTALQALALLNNGFVLTMAKHFAARSEALAPDLPGRVAAAVRLALGREPTPAELAELTAYARAHGLANTCRVLFNLNEFAFVD